jgi:hypothetical protein
LIPLLLRSGFLFLCEHLLVHNLCFSKPKAKVK